jgi:hypothetical protein
MLKIFDAITFLLFALTINTHTQVSMVIYRNIKLNLVNIFPRFYDLKQIIKVTKLYDNPIAYIFLSLCLSNDGSSQRE